MPSKIVPWYRERSAWGCCCIAAFCLTISCAVLLGEYGSLMNDRNKQTSTYNVAIDRWMTSNAAIKIRNLKSTVTFGIPPVTVGSDPLSEVPTLNTILDVVTDTDLIPTDAPEVYDYHDYIAYHRRPNKAATCVMVTSLSKDIKFNIVVYKDKSQQRRQLQTSSFDNNHSSSLSSSFIDGFTNIVRTIRYIYTSVSLSLASLLYATTITIDTTMNENGDTHLIDKEEHLNTTITNYLLQYYHQQQQKQTNQTNLTNTTIINNIPSIIWIPYEPLSIDYMIPDYHVNNNNNNHDIIKPQSTIKNPSPYPTSRQFIVTSSIVSPNPRTATISVPSISSTSSSIDNSYTNPSPSPSTASTNYHDNPYDRKLQTVTYNITGPFEWYSTVSSIGILPYQNITGIVQYGGSYYTVQDCMSACLKSSLCISYTYHDYRVTIDWRYHCYFRLDGYYPNQPWYGHWAGQKIKIPSPTPTPTRSQTPSITPSNYPISAGNNNTFNVNPQIYAQVIDYTITLPTWFSNRDVQKCGTSCVEHGPCSNYCLCPNGGTVNSDGLCEVWFQLTQLCLVIDNNYQIVRGCSKGATNFYVGNKRYDSLYNTGDGIYRYYRTTGMQNLAIYKFNPDIIIRHVDDPFFTYGSVTGYSYVLVSGNPGLGNRLGYAAAAFYIYIAIVILLRLRDKYGISFNKLLSKDTNPLSTATTPTPTTPGNPIPVQLNPIHRLNSNHHQIAYSMNYDEHNNTSGITTSSVTIPTYQFYKPTVTNLPAPFIPSNYLSMSNGSFAPSRPLPPPPPPSLSNIPIAQALPLPPPPPGISSPSSSTNTNTVSATWNNNNTNNRVSFIPSGLQSTSSDNFAISNPLRNSHTNNTNNTNSIRTNTTTPSNNRPPVSVQEDEDIPMEDPDP